MIHFYKRGGGDPAPPCVSEAENGKNEKAPTVAGTEKYGVTGAYTCFKKYCEKEAQGPQGSNKRLPSAHPASKRLPMEVQGHGKRRPSAHP